MELNENFNNSIEYTKQLLENAGNLLILIVLSIIPIINFIVLGYGWEVIRTSPGEKKLPVLGDYVKLWIQGLKIGIAGIIYMIIPLAIIFAGMGFMFIPPRPAVGAGALFVIIGILLLFLVVIIMAMGIVHMVKNNSLGKAFAFGEIWKLINNIGFGKYLIWLVVIFISALIIGAIGSLPFIGWVISGIISPFWIVFADRSAALIYADGVKQ
ncbi:MAG: DUF4013 domain-containing protein [Methanocellales archaeon]